jgi:hypothetical protein
MDMKNGPKRVLQLSIGLMRHQPYPDPKRLEQYPELQPIVEQEREVLRDTHSNQDFLYDTIEWVLKKVWSALPHL